MKNDAKLTVIVNDASDNIISENNKVTLNSIIIPQITFTTPSSATIRKIKLYINGQLYNNDGQDYIDVVSNVMPVIYNVKVNGSYPINELTAVSLDASDRESDVSDTLYVYIKDNKTVIAGIVDSLGNPVLDKKPVINPDLGQELRLTLPAGYTGTSAKLEIYTINGKKVLSTNKPLTSNYIRWDGRNYNGSVLKNGVYFVKVEGTVIPIVIMK